MRDNPEVKVITLDALTSAENPKNLEGLADPSRHTFVKGNICDQELVLSVLREQRVDTIVNCAAETQVDRLIFDPLQFL